MQVMVDSEEMIGDRMDGISLQEDSLELDTNDKGEIANDGKMEEIVR